MPFLGCRSGTTRLLEVYSPDLRKHPRFWYPAVKHIYLMVQVLTWLTYLSNTCIWYKSQRYKRTNSEKPSCCTVFLCRQVPPPEPTVLLYFCQMCIYLILSYSNQMLRTNWGETHLDRVGGGIYLKSATNGTTFCCF